MRFALADGSAIRWHQDCVASNKSRTRLCPELCGKLQLLTAAAGGRSIVLPACAVEKTPQQSWTLCLAAAPQLRIPAAAFQDGMLLDSNSMICTIHSELDAPGRCLYPEVRGGFRSKGFSDHSNK